MFSWAFILGDSSPLCTPVPPIAHFLEEEEEEVGATNGIGVTLQESQSNHIWTREQTWFLFVSRAWLIIGTSSADTWVTFRDGAVCSGGLHVEPARGPPAVSKCTSTQTVLLSQAPKSKTWGLEAASYFRVEAPWPVIGCFMLSLPLSPPYTPPGCLMRNHQF